MALLLPLYLLAKSACQDSLKGCGPQTVLRLTRTDVSAGLIAAAGLPVQQQARFFEIWRDRLRQALTDTGLSLMGRRQPVLATTIPDDFPNPSILNAYV